MRRLAVVLALLLAVTGLVPVAASGGGTAPRPGGAKVLLDPLPQQAEAGRKVTMTGRAPANRRVVVERRTGSRFVGVARTTSKPNGTFSVKVPMTKAGTVAFRAVSDGKRSKVRTLKVFRWLWVTEQPAYVDGSVVWDRTTKTPGKPLPHSVEGHDGRAAVVLKVGRCDRAEVFVTFPRYDVELFEGDEFQEVFLSPVREGDIVNEAQQSIGVDNADAPPRKLATALPEVEYLAISTSYEDADANDDLPAVMGSPRVHCAAESLPEISVDEVPV